MASLTCRVATCLGDAEFSGGTCDRHALDNGVVAYRWDGKPLTRQAATDLANRSKTKRTNNNG